MTDELFSVRDQVVLVSGASRGIGRAIAEGFAARGAQVIVTGRQRDTLEKTARELENGGKQVRAVTCDVAESESIAELVTAVSAEFGRVDTLVNVAGVNRRKRAEEFTVDDYDFIPDINLKGALLLSQAAGRALLA